MHVPKMHGQEIFKKKAQEKTKIRPNAAWYN